MRLNVYTDDDDEDRCADGKANAFALAESILVAWGLVCGLGAAPVRAQSQSADVGKILGSYAKAEGGGGKLWKVVTLRLDGTVTEINGKAPANISEVKTRRRSCESGGRGDGPSGSTGPARTAPGWRGAATYTFETKLPNRYYSEMLAGDKGWIEAFNGKSAWRENARGEIGTLVGPEGIAGGGGGAFLQYAAAESEEKPAGGDVCGECAGARAGCGGTGSDFAGGREAAGIFRRANAFDREGNGAGRRSAAGNRYDDYRAVDGVQVPYQIALRRGDDDFKIVVNRAAINERVGERIFDFPKKAQVVLPDLKELFFEDRREPESDRQDEGELRRDQGGDDVRI